MPLVRKGTRLSVMPVSPGEWKRVMEMKTARGEG
jgi:predicted RNA-binding protein with PUA-like domain